MKHAAEHITRSAACMLHDAMPEAGPYRLLMHVGIEAGQGCRRNDVIVAITWMLKCDMHQRSRPGFAAPGSANICMLTVDLFGNDVEGRFMRCLVPEGETQPSACVLCLYPTK